MHTHSHSSRTHLFQRLSELRYNTVQTFPLSFQWWSVVADQLITTLFSFTTRTLAPVVTRSLLVRYTLADTRLDTYIRYYHSGLAIQSTDTQDT
jgi:hypothetical protein